MENCGTLFRIRKRNVVWTIGHEFVAEGLHNLFAINQEYAWHALDIAVWCPDKIAASPRAEHARDALRIEVLPPFSADEAERFIEMAIGIGKTRYIFKMVRLEKFCRALFVRKMNEGKTCALCLNLTPDFFYFADRFAAKRATEVAEEHKKHRAMR